MLFPFVNHNAPSGPTVIHPVPSPVGKCVIVPSVAIRPIAFVVRFVNHNAPSGPDVMSVGVTRLPVL